MSNIKVPGDGNFSTPESEYNRLYSLILADQVMCLSYIDRSCTEMPFTKMHHVK